MPRKQRFKPSRKPKAVGTQTDFPALEHAAPVIQPTTTPEHPTSPDRTSPEEQPPEERASSGIDHGREPN